jgi:HlyD family secretion protein
MKKGIIILLAGLIVLLVSGGYFLNQYLRQEEPTPTIAHQQQEIDASTDTLDEYLDAEGKIVPSQYAQLSFTTAGTLEEMFVNEGEEVVTGDPLVRLETTDQEIALAKAIAKEQQTEANLESARSDLSAAQTGLDAAQLAVQSAEAELAQLEAQATEEMVALADQNVSVAWAALEQAQAEQTLLLESATEAEIDVAQAQVTQAEAEELVARIEYDQADENHAVPDKMESLQLNLNAAISARLAAQAVLDDLLAGPTQAEQDIAANAVNAAWHQVEAAQAELDRVTAGAGEEEIEVARAAVTQAQSKVSEAEMAVIQAETLVQIVDAQLQEASSGVQAAQLALDRRTLTAPFSGIVADLPVRQSEIIPAGTIVVTVAGQNEWQVETTDLTELNVAGITLGMDTSIYVDAFPDSQLQGIVTNVARLAGDYFGDVTYQVTVKIPESDRDLRWGMTAIVRFSNPDNSRPTAPAGIREPMAEGKIVPVSITKLSFNIAGSVAELLVNEGDSVQAGDPLVKLDAAELETALAQAQAGVASAKAALAAAQADQDKAESAVTTAESAVTVAAAHLALVQAGARSEEIAAARSRLAAAESAVAQASAGRDAALDIGTPTQIKNAERDVANALAAYQPLQDQYDDIIEACVELPDGSNYCPMYGPVEETARASVEAAQAALAAAQAVLDQLNAGSTPAQEEAANAAVTVAVSQRNAAGAELDLLLAGATPGQIRLAEIGVEQAKVGVHLAQVEVEKKQAAVLLAQAAVAEAEAGLLSVQANLERATLVTPFNGIIASLNTRTGELVTPGIPIITLIQQERWQVETVDLTELVISQVEMGMPVTVQIDALPDHTLSGAVSEIALVSNQYQGDVVYQVTIDLDDWEDLDLRWGMTTQVDFSR